MIDPDNDCSCIFEWLSVQQIVDLLQLVAAAIIVTLIVELSLISVLAFRWWKRRQSGKGRGA